MNKFTAILGAVSSAFSAAHTHHATSDERYLADASDMGDLERRMRELDDHRRGTLISGGYLAIYPAGSGR